MKITVDGIEIEGTPEEIGLVVAAMRNKKSDELLTPSTPKREFIYKPTVKTTQVSSSGNDLPENPELDQFVAALYRYKADKNTPPGRAPYIIKLLATTQKSYTVAQLQRMANANQTTVASAIRRAADAGCIIEITGNTTKLYPNTKVKMIKIGTIEEAELAKAVRAPSLNQKKSRIVEL